MVFRSASELAKYGHLVEMHVCDNVGDHLIGNVYVRYEMETEAQAAVDSLNNRWYAGSSVDIPHLRLIHVLTTSLPPRAPTLR